MNLPTEWLAAPLFLGTAGSLALAVRTWRMRPFPGRASFVCLHLSLVWWTAAVGFEHASAWPHDKVFWAEMAWLGIVGTPGSWALFTWNYIHGRYQPVSRRLGTLAAAAAVATWILALTNDAHHLLYVKTVATGTGPFEPVLYVHGLAYFLIAAVAYLVMLLTEVVVLYAAVHANDVFRKHYFVLGAASFLPLTASVVYFARAAGIGSEAVDPTPFAAVLMNAIFYWMIRRQQAFDVLPMAHSVLLNAIPDPVFVLDGELRIAACNPAASLLVGHRSLVGVALSAVPELHEGLTTGSEVVVGEPARYFDVREVPLRYAGRDVGRLVVLRDVSSRKEAETQLQRALSELERQLDGNIALQRQLREASIRDALTGLHNRRFLDELAPIMLSDAERTGAPLSAVMLDIDHFKRFNDTYGHQTGDALLRATGAMLLQNVRQTDAVFRMGGEEFLVLLPHTQAAQAVGRATAWLREFAAQPIRHEETDLSATISAGVAVYPSDAANLQQLIHRADLALYRAKANGRNCVAEWSLSEQRSM